MKIKVKKLSTAWVVTLFGQKKGTSNALHLFFSSKERDAFEKAHKDEDYSVSRATFYHERSHNPTALKKQKEREARFIAKAKRLPKKGETWTRPYGWPTKAVIVRAGKTVQFQPAWRTPDSAPMKPMVFCLYDFLQHFTFESAPALAAPTSVAGE